MSVRIFKNKTLSALPGKAPALPGAFEIEYTAQDGAQHRVPLAEAAVVRFADARPTRRIRTRKGYRDRVIPQVDIAVVRPGESCAGGDFRKLARSLADCWRGVRC